jgi:hypothetical protein
LCGIAFYFGITWGVVGVAVGYGIASVPVVAIAVTLIKNAIGASWLDVFRAYAPALSACGAMRVGIFIIAAPLSGYLAEHMLGLLLAKIAVGVGIYLVATRFVATKEWFEAWRMVQVRMKKVVVLLNG